MSGAIPPLSQYAFMAWCLITEITLPLPLYIVSAVLYVKISSFKFVHIRILAEKLLVAQIVKKELVFYETRRFITVFTRVR
jgi:hypothetical protein